MLVGKWTAAKKSVACRDEDKCQRCSRPASDIHHRKPRGMGGSSDPDRNYGLANLISLCHECHWWVHAHPAEAYRLGWLVHSYDDPERVSVITPGYLLWLKPDGTAVREGECAAF